jgi:carbon storage regulator
MLVIRRRPGESIRIGEDVEIEIIECGPHRVKLGVRAPKEVAVWRGETQAAREQNLQAAGWDGERALASLAQHRGLADALHSASGIKGSTL